ncbi:peptidylprolyl isomerase [bacterium]|nr:peptidylprolyl isomerase [bacterium]
MRRILTVATGVVFLSVLMSGCVSPHKEGVVAKVGNYEITAEELNKKVGNARFKSYEDELKRRKKIVEDMAEDKLMILAAYDAGLDKDEEILKSLEENKDSRLNRALYKMVVTEKVKDVSDDQIKKVYERMKTKVHAKHILVDSKELADSIYQALQNGADFDELAKKYSKDVSNKDKGGDLGFFTALDMVEPFEDAAYATEPGKISKPVKTRFGWHIIKVVEKVPNNTLPDYDIMKERIANRLKSRLRTKLAQAFVDSLKEAANFKFNDDATQVVIKRYKEMKQGGENAKPVLNFTPDERRMQLATYKYGTITIEDLDTTFKKIPPMRQPRLETLEGVKDFVKMIPQMTLVKKAAEDLNVENSPEYKELYQQELESRIKAKFRKNVLFKDVKVTDEEAKKFYDAHPDSFIDSAKVHILEIQVSDSALAVKLIKQLKNGADFKKLAEKYTERNYVKNRGGDLGSFDHRRYPPLFEAAQKLKPGEIYPEPIRMGSKFSIIKLVEKIPPKRKPFDLLKNRIKSHLVRQKREEAFNKWMESAKKKFGFKIYEDEIAKTIDKSKYETASAKDTTAKK